MRKAGFCLRKNTSKLGVGWEMYHSLSINDMINGSLHWNYKL